MHYFLSNDFKSAALRLKHSFLCVFQKFEIEKAYFAGKFERIWGFGGAKFFLSQK